MDGWQLLRLLRSRAETRHTPFLFLTRLGSEEERLRGYQLGVDDYLAKPFRAVELRARIDRLVARKHSPSPVAHALRGDLSLVSLPSLLSFLEMERRTGQLSVSGPRQGTLLLDAGRPVRVALEGCDEPPADRMLRFLDLADGEFEFVAQPVDSVDEIRMGLTQLLLEHARIQDETQHG
jgi:DNA-binding response OmpR family regulator